MDQHCHQQSRETDTHAAGLVAGAFRERRVVMRGTLDPAAP